MLFRSRTGSFGEHFSVYQINLRTSIAVWTENYTFLGLPRGKLSIGKCRERP